MQDICTHEAPEMLSVTKHPEHLSACHLRTGAYTHMDVERAVRSSSKTFWIGLGATVANGVDAAEPLVGYCGSDPYDVDEILTPLENRIAVMYEGKIMSIVPRQEATPEKSGMLMAGVVEEPS